MLKSILSVSGKPGLYKLVSNSKNMIIVESLSDKRKMPVHARDKVVSLGDISIYTEGDDDEPLKNVFVAMKQKENGQKASISTSAKPDDLKKYFGEILPAFNKERVYPTDIKKMISWYNLLIETDTDFETEEKAEEAEVAEATENKE